MVKVFTYKAGETLDAMFQRVRDKIFTGQIHEYAYGKQEEPRNWNDVRGIIADVVETRKNKGGMSWAEVYFFFETEEDICEFLLTRVKAETMQLERPRPDRAVADVCYSLAKGSGHGSIAYLTGYSPNEINAIATQEAGFIRYLKARHEDGYAPYEKLMDEWELFH